eukprot:3931856-Pyramimonas_sp.AAC.1
MFWLLKLVRAAVRLGLPPTVLYLEILQCACPRTLNQISAFSEPIEVTRSIVQGLRGGARYARIMTFFVMQKICTALPSFSHRLWLDDLSLSTKGSHRQIRKDMGKCLSDTAVALKAQGLRIASEPAIACSHHPDAVAISKALRRKGIMVHAVLQCSYLGIDLSGGRRQA